MLYSNIPVALTQGSRLAAQTQSAERKKWSWAAATRWFVLLVGNSLLIYFTINNWIFNVFDPSWKNHFTNNQTGLNVCQSNTFPHSSCQANFQIFKSHHSHVVFASKKNKKVGGVAGGGGGQCWHGACQLGIAHFFRLLMSIYTSEVWSVLGCSQRC